MIKRFIFIILISIAFSCSTSKDIIYVQDLDKNTSNKIEYNEYLLKPDDVLKIDVSSENPQTVNAFRSDITFNSSNATMIGMIYNGYKVNNSGEIFFPTIGKIKVVGKTVDEVRQYISDYLTDGGFLTKLVIDVKLINASFTILGEVNMPGKHQFNQNNLNILEAIGIAGDLTINGKRDNITLIREIDNKRISTTYDLTSSKIFESDNFQIFPGDIIIVSPNSNRVKNAGLIGNSGTLLSLLSFVLSSIIVASSNL